MFNPNVGVETLKKSFLLNNRLHIPNIFDPMLMQNLLEEINQGLPWRLSINDKKNSFDLSLTELSTLEKEVLDNIDKLIYRQASMGFQYKFDSYRLSDEVEAGRCSFPKLIDFYQFLNSDQFLTFIAKLTSDNRGIYCDAQVTRFRDGHFLTSHTDESVEKQRLFAIVVNLTPLWRADWGGLLQFISPNGHVDEAFTPTMNALNIFKIPQSHSVSFVAPFAAGPRISITGWIRMNKESGRAY